jgi:hypothetical protein
MKLLGLLLLLAVVYGFMPTGPVSAQVRTKSTILMDGKTRILAGKPNHDMSSTRASLCVRACSINSTLL